MPTLGDIINTIQDKLLDDSYTNEILTRTINSGYRYCAYVALLPDLESSGYFETSPGVNRVAIPESWNFSKNLYAANVADAPPIQALSSIGLLKRENPEIDSAVEIGGIQYIAIQRNDIVYTPSPKEITRVYCKFFRHPEMLEALTDTPVSLPLELQENLLASYALWKCFESIEDGIEGSKVNTEYYKNEFKEYLGALVELFDRGQSTSTPQRQTSWI